MTTTKKKETLFAQLLAKYATAGLVYAALN